MLPSFTNEPMRWLLLRAGRFVLLAEDLAVLVHQDAVLLAVLAGVVGLEGLLAAVLGAVVLDVAGALGDPADLRLRLARHRVELDAAGRIVVVGLLRR